MQKKVFLLGSTGSIGKNTLKSISHLNKLGHDFKITGLAAGSSLALLKRQIARFHPGVVYIKSESGCKSLKKNFPRLKIFSGREGLQAALAAGDFDLFVNSIVGSQGLVPTLTAITKKADIALANKESLVAGGQLVKKALHKHRVNLIPVDSEHSAVFHILKGVAPANINKLIITASGGPFFFKPVKNPSPEQTLAHPTWKMGPKITIDSATMMNKGFEIIEAHYLFDLSYDMIETVIHPQSLIHSMVESKDGEIYAQLGKNDMRLPIQNALTYPVIEKNMVKPLKLWETKALSFFKPDFKKFPLLKL
ncbi:MAG TPA: 1-deoxy-D-xylulose-5-phosphate reductoisomerase, partial [Spirochaetota bacterium]|nr:1-deoxy-D-xylulose-5-phosphate reductoisomerase [Spirochaetota bacterium]